MWNSNGGGTDGGVSMLFALPGYQDNAGVPKASAKTGGRGVPDVAGDAHPYSGYRIITGGQTGIIGGTCAVAPLWAGIVAGLNAARKAPLGQIHAQLYEDPAALRDIVSGNNKSGAVGFEAGKGWDPCTGLDRPMQLGWRLCFRRSPDCSRRKPDVRAKCRWPEGPLHLQGHSSQRLASSMVADCRPRRNTVHTL